MRRQRKKGEQTLSLHLFSAREKWRWIAQVSRTSAADHDSSVSRANSFALQDESSKCRFPRCALQTSPHDNLLITKICTTCTYYREILSLPALWSGRTIEYCVLLNLRTIEKRKDWIWTGFQSGPPFFVHRACKCWRHNRARCMETHSNGKTGSKQR